eukprot:m51a1_g5174 hypothetical protein (488) ;mRNA; r:148121-150109
MNKRSLFALLLAALAGAAAATTAKTLSEFHSIFASHLHHYSNLSAVDAAFARVKPSDCRKTESGLQLSNGADPLAPLAARRAAGKAPVTIVSLNGMAGEFVPRPALSVAYNSSSSFALAYKQLLRDNPDLTVPVVDAPDGTPLYNVVFFVQREGSLESLLLPDVVVPRIIQRMSLFLDLVGNHVDDFVLVGFSRGSIDAVTIMARHATIPWGNRIRGVITLDGVVYGTSMADCGLGETTSNPPSLCEIASNMMAWVELLANGLVPSLLNIPQNTAIITRVATEAAAAIARIGVPEKLKQSHLVFPDVLRSFEELIRDVLFDFDLLHPVLDYEDNIQKLKNLLGGLLDSMRLLSTKTRTEWWATHTLPADRLYASSTGTMADFDYTYPEVHPDEFGMRYLYYVTAQAGGQELVDGPVQSARQMILPNVHRGLNPHQEPYEAHWLGLFHTTHAGSVLDYALPCPDNWVDPFPRKTLVDSFATWIATRSN